MKHLFRGSLRAHVLLLLLSVELCHAQSVRQDVPRPTPAQQAWQEAGLGVIFHYDLHVFDGKKYDQRSNRISPVADYNIFNPSQLDTDQWILSAKAAGATFAILTVTHETGFALYQSDVTPYSLKALRWRDGKGDILADFVASCQKYGIKPAIYIGIRWNAFMGVHDFKVEGDTEFSRNRQQYYNRYCERMTTEQLSRYGKFFFIWFDGGAHGPEQGGPDILPIAEKYQPDAIFYHNLQRADVRWCGSESGTVPYPCWSGFDHPSWFQHRDDKNDFRSLKHGSENGAYYMPAMADAPLRGYKGRHEWFWEPGDEAHIYPVGRLVDMYERSVGHNATLILGLTPDPDGRIPVADADTLKAFGEAIRKRYERPLAATSGDARELVLTLPQGQLFDAVSVSEDIAKGQRIRAFSVQALVNRRWETLVSGTSVGHRFMARLKELVSAGRVRLVVDRSVGQPSIKGFSLYRVGSD